VPEFVARVHLALGNEARALEWLDRGVEERSAVAPMVATWSDFEPLLDIPGCKKCGFGSVSECPFDRRRKRLRARRPLKR
jgi:hypothetical protein